MDASKKKNNPVIQEANAFADFSLEGFCWFVFHQPRIPDALLEKKKEK